MPARFDNEKGAPQFLFFVERQSSSELGMNRVLRRWLDAQIDHAGCAPMHEDEATEIPIASDEEVTLLMSNEKQFGVVGLCQTKLRCRSHFVP